MANKKITALPALTSPASGDLLAVVDVSDTSEATSGTTKKIAVSDLVTGGVVPDDSVTNAKLANMAQATIKGRASGAGTGDPTDLTGTQATAILDAMVGDSGSGGTKGLAPAPASGDAAASKFLKADGTWATPSGTGAPADATYITQTPSGGLSNEQAMSSLATGLVKNTTTTGVQSIADANDLSSPVYAADAGSNDTYAITLSPAPSAYQTGAHYRFKANTANTGACSLNVNGLGAKTIKKVAGGITTDLSDNDIRAGQFVEVVYDGTNFQIQSTLGNAGGGGAPGGSSGDIQYNDGAGGFAGAPIKRADANTIDHYNGTGETPTRYNFFTNRADASNYDQLAIYYHTANDQWWIDTTKAGTGTTRSLNISISGSAKWQFHTSGELKGQDSSNSKISVAAGTAGSPSLQFGIGGSNTGFFNPSGSAVGVANGGNYWTRFYDGGVMLSNNGMFTFSNGSVGSSTTADAGIARPAAGFIEINNGTAGQRGGLLLRGMTFAQLPGSPIAGMEATITDCNTTTWGATAAGGGANTVRVWYNGANWKVIGI